MPRITLYEPTIAAEHQADYVGSAAVGSKLFFPHVDTCCALAAVLSNGTVVGGHVPLLWGGPNDGDAATNMQRVWGRLGTLRQAINGPPTVVGIIAVGPFHWTAPYSVIQGNFDPGFTFDFPSLRVDTQQAANGADVTIKVTGAGIVVKVKDFKTAAVKRYQMPTDTQDATF